MNRIRTLLSATAMAGLGACTIGSNAATSRVATFPEGARVTVQTAVSGNHVAELLEVRDDGLVLDASKRIVFVPFTAVRRVTTDKLGAAFSLDRGGLPDAVKLAAIRSVSHFPQGMTPEIQRILLAKAGQPDLVVIQ